MTLQGRKRYALGGDGVLKRTFFNLMRLEGEHLQPFDAPHEVLTVRIPDLQSMREKFK